MFKKNKLIYSICLLLIPIFVLVNLEGVVLAKENESKIILIDPGHGGLDGGAVSINGTIEKNINLNIAKKLKLKLEEKNFKVIMTREEDKGLYSDKGKVRDKKIEDLNNRCKMKKESDCDVFISIHLNMFQQKKYYGAQVWYEKGDESAMLAHIVQQNLIKDLNNGNKRKEKRAKGAYKVLRCNCDVPSILVECGFLSNEEEEIKLKSDLYQEEISTSLANSLQEYFKCEKEEENIENGEVNKKINFKRIWKIFNNKIYK